MAKKGGKYNKGGGLQERKLTDKQLKNKERSQKKQWKSEIKANNNPIILQSDESDCEYINKNGNRYVLAMYDVRGKQNFIFKSSHLKEIVGGSAIIRDIFNDYFYQSVEKIGRNRKPAGDLKKYIYRYDLAGWGDEESDLTRDNFEEHLKQGAVAELVYNGGGNFFVLFENIDIFKDVTYEFTKEILKSIGTLHVLATGIEGVNFDDYNEDRRRIYAKHSKHEMKKNIVRPWGTIPIVQVDYDNSMPLVAKHHVPEIKNVTKESLMKYKKYNSLDEGAEYQNKEGEEYLYNLVTKKYKKNDSLDEKAEHRNEEGEKVLDKLVTKKGEESLLAVVYIDGNGMGAKVEKKTQGKATYKDCANALRDFSREIQQDYIKYPISEIDKVLDCIHSDEKDYKPGQKRRMVIYAGDEINFICNARDALILTKTYMNSLKEGESACAGVSIFHSHAPYVDAYRIAEECCESGKKKMKRTTCGEEMKQACFIDVHYCQGAIGTSLEAIREREVGSLCSKPWLISIDEKEKGKLQDREYSTLEEVEKAADLLNKLGRSNVKGLAESARNNSSEYNLELRRIKSHMNQEKRGLIDFDFLEKHRKLIYDTVILFDLWFASKEETPASDLQEGEA